MQIEAARQVIQMTVRLALLTTLLCRSYQSLKLIFEKLLQLVFIATHNTQVDIIQHFEPRKPSRCMDV